MVTKEKLEELVQKGYTKRKVSEELTIGYSTVYKYMSKYGLKFNAREDDILVEHNCLTCGEKDPKNFYGSRKIQCKKCFNIECGEKLKAQKVKAVEHHGGCCSRCGYDKTIAALEFHHKDPAQKDPSWRMGWSWKRLKVELDKCIILCANCHREIHEEMRIGE